MTQIERDAVVVLHVLAKAARDQYVEAQEIGQEAGLEADRLNDAMAFLVDNGYAEWIQVMGTAPYDFSDANITPRGRYESQRLVEAAAQSQSASGDPQASVANRSDDVLRAGDSLPLPPAPIGSPYGFTDED